MIIKSAVLAAWREVLSKRLSNLESNRTAAQSGTRVDGEHRPSNRGERAAVTSQGYLALGLAERAVAIQANIESLENMGDGPRKDVAIGALLTFVSRFWPPSALRYFARRRCDSVEDRWANNDRTQYEFAAGLPTAWVGTRRCTGD
jgi:hypothetical protein